MSKPESDIDRIAELESQLLFQEDLLQSLNKVVIRQEEQIEKLERELRAIREQITVVMQEQGKNPAEEPPPPHY